MKKFPIGTRVQVVGGSGIDSGKTGTIAAFSEVMVDGRGIPINVKGAYKPVDWKRESAVRLDDGSLTTMFDNRLRRSYQPNPRKTLPKFGSLSREQMLDDAVFRGVVNALHFTESDELGDAKLSLEAMDRLFLETRLFVIRANPWLYGILPEQIGHDFWLTRNHHGAGFWDRDLSNGRGEILTQIAHSFGELSPYVGDDGQIHF